MTVVSVEKDFDSLSLTLVAELDAQDGTPNVEMPTTAAQVRLAKEAGRTRMELRFVFESSEHMEQLERWGAFEVFPQSVGQMDAILAESTEGVP